MYGRILAHVSNGQRTLYNYESNAHQHKHDVASHYSLYCTKVDRRHYVVMAMGIISNMDFVARSFSNHHIAIRSVDHK
jgi:hypothetical protein